MFVLGDANDRVYEYDLSAPYDVSTSEFIYSFSIAAQQTDPTGIVFSNNATRMFIVGDTYNDIHEYSLGENGFEPSTIASNGNQTLYTISNPQDVAFSRDGFKMFTIDNNTALITQYLLSTQFNVSTSSFNGTFSVASQETNPTSMTFSANGLLMFVVGTNSTVFEYTLVQPFDLSAVFFNNVTFPVDRNGPVDLRGIIFDDDGDRMFLLSSIGRIHQYSLETNFRLDPAPEFTTRIISPAFNQDVHRDISFSGTGNKLFVVLDNARILDIDLSSPYYAASASSTLGNTPIFHDFPTDSIDGAPTGIVFSFDGSKMFLVGTDTKRVHEYLLDAPFDLFDVGNHVELVDTRNRIVNTFNNHPSGTTVEDIAFSHDGLRMFVANSDFDSVVQYRLTTAFDVSSAVFDYTFPFPNPYGINEDEFRILAQPGNRDIANTPRAVTFSHDGFRVFIAGHNDQVYSYGLVEPFNLRNLVPFDSDNGFDDFFLISVNFLPTNVLVFAEDGLVHIQTIQSVSGTVENGLSYTKHRNHPYDVVLTPNPNPTIINKIIFRLINIHGGVIEINDFHNTHLSASDSTIITGIAFSADGRKLFIAASNHQFIREYTLGAPHDITNMRQTGSFEVGPGTVSSIAFSTDGLNMYVSKINGDIIQYRLHDPFDFRNIVGSADADTATFTIGTDSRGIAFSNDGSKMFNLDQNSHAIAQYDLSTPFDTSTLSIADVILISDDIVLNHRLNDIAVSSDGRKIFIISQGRNEIHQYTLSTPFDISTSEYDHAFSVADQERAPQDAVFSPDGRKMFVLGAIATELQVDPDTQTAQIHEYNLVTAFDVSTAGYTDSFTIDDQSNRPRGIAFTTDGYIMFTIDSENLQINEYQLSTSFDISTTSFLGDFSTASQEETFPTGIALSNDESKMFIVGSDTDKVHEYYLDITTRFIDADIAPTRIFDSVDTILFDDTGHKMFVASTGIDSKIHEYALSTPFDLSTLTIDYTLDISDSFSTMALSKDGFNLFVGMSGTSTVSLYILNPPFDLSTASPPIPLNPFSNLERIDDLLFSDDGSRLFITGLSSDNAASGIYETHTYILNPPFHPSTIQSRESINFENTDGIASLIGSTVRFGESIDFELESSFSADRVFSTNGSTMFVLDSGISGNSNANPKVDEYSIPTPFDISSPTHLYSFPLNSPLSTPDGIAFSNAGDKMFVLNKKPAVAHQYGLATNFTLANASPTFTASRTALNTIILTFNEPVTATRALTSGSSWFISDDTGARAGTVVSNTIPRGGTTMILTTSGILGTSATPTVTYLAPTGDIVDSFGIEVINGTSAIATDSIPPVFVNATIDALSTITINLNEDIIDNDIIANGFTVSGHASNKTITHTNITGSTIVLTFEPNTFIDAQDQDNVRITYDDTIGDIRDLAQNKLASFTNASLSDGPLFFAANRTGVNTIVLTFIDTVTATSATSGSSWVLSDDTGARTGTVVSNTLPNNSTTMTLTTSGVLGTDATPTVTYLASAGDIVDSNEVEMANGTSAIAIDSVNPVLLHGNITGIRFIQLTISESIYSLNPVPTTDFVIDGIPGASVGQVIIDSNSRAGAPQISLLISSSVDINSPDYTATLSYTPSSPTSQILDESDNPLLGFDQILLINNADTTPSTFTANRTGENTIILTFNEPVTATSATSGSSWVLSDDTGARTGTVVSNTLPNNSITMTLTTSGVLGTDATPTVTYLASAGDVVDSNNGFKMVNGTSAIATDSINPIVLNANVVAPKIILILPSEDVVLAELGSAHEAFTLNGVPDAEITSAAVLFSNGDTYVALHLNPDAAGPSITSNHTTITLSYAGTSTGPVVDISSNPLESFDQIFVDNNFDTTPPTFVNATIDTPTQITVNLSEVVIGTNSLTTSFVISGHASNKPIDSMAITGSTAILTFESGAFSETDQGNVRIAYVRSPGDIRDPSNNYLESFGNPITPNSTNPIVINTLDTTPPTFVNATIDSTTQITVNLSENVIGNNTQLSSFIIFGPTSPFNQPTEHERSRGPYCTTNI